MVPETSGATIDNAPEIVPLSFLKESHTQLSDSVRQLPADDSSSDSALTVMLNGCKVTIHNNALERRYSSLTIFICVLYFCCAFWANFVLTIYSMTFWKNVFTRWTYY